MRQLHKENYFHQFNTRRLKSLMTSINSYFVLCSCTACQETGRHDVTASPSTARCSFTPYWEELLGIYDISFEFKPRDAPLDHFKKLSGAVMESNAALVNVSRPLKTLMPPV